MEVMKLFSAEEAIGAGFAIAIIVVFLLAYLAMQAIEKRRNIMRTAKGFLVGCGYMGWVPWLNQYLLFATEGEYMEYMRTNQ